MKKKRFITGLLVTSLLCSLPHTPLHSFSKRQSALIGALIFVASLVTGDRLKKKYTNPLEKEEANLAQIQTALANTEQQSPEEKITLEQHQKELLKKIKSLRRAQKLSYVLSGLAFLTIIISWLSLDIKHKDKMRECEINRNFQKMYADILPISVQEIATQITDTQIILSKTSLRFIGLSVLNVLEKHLRTVAAEKTIPVPGTPISNPIIITQTFKTIDEIRTFIASHERTQQYCPEVAYSFSLLKALLGLKWLVDMKNQNESFDTLTQQDKNYILNLVQSGITGIQQYTCPEENKAQLQQAKTLTKQWAKEVESYLTQQNQATYYFRLD